MLCVILHANSEAEFDVYGPFDTQAEAHTWAADNPEFDGDWKIVPLKFPADHTEE